MRQSVYIIIKGFEECKANAKLTWRLLNEVLNNKKSKSRLLTFFNVNNRQISDPVQIANHSCEHFSNIGPNLPKSIPTSSLSNRLFLSGNIVNFLLFKAYN